MPVRKAPENRKKERGTILIVALLIIVGLLILSSPFILNLSGQYRLTDRSFKALVALNLAEAGVERAIWELNYGDILTWGGDQSLRTKNITSSEVEAGEIAVSLFDPSSENPVVESTGRVALSALVAVEKTARVILAGSTGSFLFNFGIFGKEGVELHGDSTIDSYDSRLGDYGELVDGEPNIGSEGHTGTNSVLAGSIKLLNFASIHGNAVSGPDSNPEEVISVGPNADIYGEKLALSKLKDFPGVASPSGLPFRGSYRLRNGQQDTITSNGEYSSFTLDNSASVTIAADVTLYITGDFVMGNGAQLEVQEGASMKIYFGSGFEQKNGAALNNPSRDPTRLIVLGTSTFASMRWKNSSDFWGAIYVPEADVVIDNSAQFYGSVIADSILVQSTGGIHYDVALRDVNVFKESGRNSYVVQSWQQVIH